ASVFGRVKGDFHIIIVVTETGQSKPFYSYVLRTSPVAHPGGFFAYLSTYTRKKYLHALSLSKAELLRNFLEDAQETNLKQTLGYGSSSPA
ncbi:MAG: hypothetical protein L0H54_02725, partial [Alcaligenaceae bacterium]|nr:hypothetical protein [Alcaligenaceae bacterium]